LANDNPKVEDPVMMRFYMMATVLSAVTLLSGCGLANYQLQQDRQQCALYGFQPGTDAFAQCMQKTSVERDRMAIMQTMIRPRY